MFLWNVKTSFVTTRRLASIDFFLLKKSFLFFFLQIKMFKCPK